MRARGQAHVFTVAIGKGGRVVGRGQKIDRTGERER